MQRGAGLRGGSADANRDDKMSGGAKAYGSGTPGWMRVIKRTANAKRRRHGRDIIRRRED